MSGTNLQETLKDSGASASAGRGAERVRVALVVSEVALACVLIVGAGLLLRSFLHVLDVDLGFRPATAATLPLDLPDNLRGKLPERTVFYQNVFREISSIQGVEAVGVSDNLPLARNRSWGPPGIKGVDYPRNARASTLVYIASPGYFAAMGMPITGREFTWHDDKNSEKVVIINRSAANFLFPNQDPIGKMIQYGGADERIIGITPDVHTTGAEASTGWQVYLPIAQDWGEDGAHLVIRSRLPAETLAPEVLSKLRALNPGQPLVELQPVQQIVDHATSPRRFFAVLVGLFATLGLILASLGIYGVISYTVTRQTQEIGIRMALGATQASVQGRILRATLRMALIGIAIGAIASLLLSRLIASMLFATEASDPVTFATTVAVLVAVAITAAYLPARRASQINPMIALRNS